MISIVVITSINKWLNRIDKPRGIYLPLYVFLVQYVYYVKFLIRGSSEYGDM